MAFIQCIKTLNEIIWGLPLIALLVGVGLFFSCRLRFIQIKHLREAFRYTLKPSSQEPNSDSTSILGDISSFGSLCTALSATLGTGNIVGIAVALSVGGPGSLFWLIASSFFCLATKYCEGFLAIKYRKKGSDGKVAGGPMYYIEQSFKSKFWAKAFAFLGIGVALVGIGTLAQTNSIAAIGTSIGIPKSFSAIILGIIIALVICGGIRLIADVAEKIVPAMTILYLGTACLILLLKFNLIWPACQLIIKDAFAPQAALGGSFGTAFLSSLKVGISRGIFCHESGLGSAAIAAAAAKILSPVKQGLICMVGAFLSIIVCSITGLVLVITLGAQRGHGFEAIATALAFGEGLGIPQLGQLIVNVSICFFAFTTIIGWSYYGEKCTQYLFSIKAVPIYRALFLLFIVLGPFLEIKEAFIIADIVIGLMALPNILSLLLLRQEIVIETKEFFKTS